MSTQTSNTRRASTRSNNPAVVRGGGSRGSNVPVPTLISDAMRAAPVLSPADERALAERIVTAHAAAWGACLGPRCVRPSRRAVLLARACEDAGVDCFPAVADDTHLDLADVPAVIVNARIADPDQHVLRALQAVVLADCDDTWSSPRASASSVHRAESWRYEVLSTARDLARLEDRMVRHNLGLAVSIARVYATGPIPVADLVQEACVGLLDAIRRFDPSLGWRFSSLAVWRVRYAVSRYVANSRHTVRLPVHLQQRARDLARMDADAVAVIDAATTNPASRDVLLQALALATEGTPVGSMDRVVAGKKDGSAPLTLADTMPDPSPSPEDFAARDDLRLALADAVALLPAPEAETLTIVAGIGTAPMQVADLADLTDRPRNAVSSEYRHALRLLRHAPELRVAAGRC